MSEAALASQDGRRQEAESPTRSAVGWRGRFGVGRRADREETVVIDTVGAVFEAHGRRFGGDRDDLARAA